MLRRLAIVLAGVVVMASCRGGGSSSTTSTRAEQVRAAARQAGLSPAVSDFMASAVGASGRSYTVTYDLGDSRATVTQKPPWQRLEVVSPAGDVDAYIANRDGTFSCHRPAGGAWSCQPASEPPPATGALSLDDTVAAVTALTQSASAYSMNVSSRRVAAVDASCLVATPKTAGQSAETLCIAPSGVPLLIEGGAMGQGVRATKYRPSASNSAFKLPAPARSD